MNFFKMSDDDEDKEEESNESSDDDESDTPSESSSDDEHTWKQSIKDQYKQIQKEKRMKSGVDGQPPPPTSKQPKFYEIKESTGDFYKPSENKNLLRSEKLKKLSLASRLEHEATNRDTSDTTTVFRNDSFGNKQMTFISRRERKQKDAQKKAIEHHMERKGIRRSAGKIIKTLQKPNIKIFNKNK